MNAWLIAQTLEDGSLSSKAQIIGVIVAIAVFVFVIELVRRRRLVERYALLWMLASSLGVVLAVWNDGLDWIAGQVGIASPPNALFLIGLIAVFALLLNFSVAISRLSEETKILAQTVSRLDAEQRKLQGKGARANGGRPAETAGRASADEQADDPPVAREQGSQQG